MSETTKYRGGCHCGEIRYEVELDLKGGAGSCNCSICSKSGWLLAFADAAKFELLSGADKLVDYQFGRMSTHHVFCSRCGVRSFSHGTAPDGREVRAINLRCLDDLDLSALPVHHYDGKSL